ncbi:hypothetical protein OS31_39250 [Dickeya oryzae]
MEHSVIEPTVPMPMPAMFDAPSGIFDSLDDAVQAAAYAQQQLNSVELRQQVIKAIRVAGERYAQVLAEMAVAETGMGRVVDKYIKKRVTGAPYTRDRMPVGGSTDRR